MSGYDVHIVGSVPLANAAEVFRKVSAALGPKLRRIPDGETGERLDWITWLEPVFSQDPVLEITSEVFRTHAIGTASPQYRLRSGASLSDAQFTKLFYADHATASYRVFAELFYMPALRNRSDHAYFESLGKLKLRPETPQSRPRSLHRWLDGTRQRIALAEKYVKDFLIATECGFGRRLLEAIDQLLKIHAAVAGV